MKQKITLLLLSLAMVLSLCTVLSFGGFAEESAEAWDGSVATAYAGGSGTPEDPYQIANGAQLAYMAQQVNAGINADKSFVLTADIALNDVTDYESFSSAAPANKWTAIGKLVGGAEGTVYPFMGSFDGQGHTIEGLYFFFRDVADYYHGLFGYAQDATIKNVVLSKGYVSSAFYLGALVGYADNCEISGITNESVALYGYKDRYNHAYHVVVGGIVGGAVSSDIYDCHNKATVTGANVGNSAAACGYAMNVHAAGVVATTIGSADAYTNVSGCTNTGAVSGQFAHNYQTGYVGGIVSNAVYTNISGCYAACDVTYNLPGTGYVGGIAGRAENAGLYANVAATNVLYVKAGNNRNDAHKSCGGIVGNTKTVTLENNVFYGTQTIDAENAAYVERSGAVVGYAETNAYLRNNSYFVDAATTGVTNAIGSKTAPKENTNTVALTAQTLAEQALVDSINTYVRSKNVNSGLFAQGATGPVYAAPYFENYAIIIADNANGTATIENATCDGGYKAGDVIVLTMNAADGFIPVKIEYSYGDVTEIATRGMDGKYRFVMPSAPVTLTLFFIEGTADTDYTVTFLTKDGELIEEQVIEIGLSATPPAPPAVYSYEFAGWVDENGTLVNFNNVATDIVVKASYREIYCSVTFLAKDGSVIDTLSVRFGTAVSAPAAPVLEGYEFAGWDVAFDNVTTDLTVTAQYTFTGSFFDGGFGTPEDPFLISSAAQLVDMAAKMAADTEGLFINGCYELTADIDLAGITWTPIPTFAGSIDGNGHSISNLKLKSGGAEYAMYLSVTNATFKNLTMKDCEVSNSGNQTRAILIANAQGMLLIQNCHIVNGKIGTGSLAGLFVGKANVDSALFENCTAEGSVNASNLNAILGGFVGNGKNITFKNCISQFTVYNRNINIAGGFVGTSDGGNTFENCISFADISIDPARTRASSIGGFVGSISNNSSLTADGCTFYGTLANHAPSQVAGGFAANVPSNGTLTITNSAFYGSVYAMGKAGGLVSALTDATRQTMIVENVVILADISCGAEGIKGAVAASIKAHSNTSVKNVYVLSADLIVEPTTAIKNYECIVLDSTTTLPEGLSSDVWTVGALPVISGASVSFGGSVALNVYAEYGIVLKAHAADTLFVDGKAVAYANKVVLDGKTYAQFAFDGIKMADIETKYALSVISGIKQMEYSVFTYITNTYAEADATLQNVLVALLCYGNAAQAEPTAVANAIVAIPELEAIVADYVEANYANVALTPVQSEGLKVGFNLYGFVQPVFKVADSITRVTVEMNGIISELVISDGYAFYYDLSMLDLNEAMTVTLYEGENAVLVAEYAVANYLAEGIAGDTLTDAQKNLCKAYAVFVDTLLSYANN